MGEVPKSLPVPAVREFDGIAWVRSADYQRAAAMADGWRLKYKALDAAMEPELQRQLRNERRIRELEVEVRRLKLEARDG